MQRALHFQADRIEMVLARYKVPARVTGGKVTPRLVRYYLSTPLGVRVKRVAGLADELALSLGAPSCQVYHREGQVQVEVPRTDRQVVKLGEVCQELQGWGRGTVPPVTAVIGLDAEGAPLLLRLPSPDMAHVLIAGTTGSGKTALARTLVTSLAMFNSQRVLQVVLIDPGGRGLMPFEGLPHLLVPVVTQADEALRVLGRLVAVMDRRDRERCVEPRLVVVLDRLADLVQVGGREMEGLVMRLTQRGREAGIHLVACIQKPAATVIGGVVKSNFPVRIVGSVASPEDARVAAGLSGTGAERLQGQGDFLVVVKGRVIRMQAAYTEEDEVQTLVEQLRNGSRSPLTAGTGTTGPDQEPATRAGSLHSRLRWTRWERDGAGGRRHR